MSNIIFNIYTRVNSKLAPNSNETMDAMMAAAEIMNEQHSKEELTEIKEFTKNLNPSTIQDSSLYTMKKLLQKSGRSLVG